MPEKDVKVPGKKELEVYVDAPYVVVRLVNPVKTPFTDYSEHHLSDDEAMKFLARFGEAVGQNKIIVAELKAAEEHGTAGDQERLKDELQRREAAIARMEAEGAS